MKYARIFIVLATFCCFILSDAKIIETSHIADVIPLIDQNTWFLVDLDNTLFEAKQALGHANWFYDQLQQKMDKGLTREEAFGEFYPEWIRIQKICPVKPLEEEFISAIHAMQDKNIVVMGFTHRQVSIVDSTLVQVKSLGVDFTLTSPSKETFSVTAKTPTLYTHGILFVDDFNKKGEVLLPFLSIVGKLPKKVVFIDDKLKNVEEVESMLEPLGINYIGIYYTAIQKMPQVYSAEIAAFQYQFLNTIISNEAAKLLIDHSLKIQTAP